MHTQKIAITIPKDIVATIDEIAKQQRLSRSKLISAILKEKIVMEKNRMVKDAYDRVFSDSSVQEEQLDWTNWNEKNGTKEGQEW